MQDKKCYKCGNKVTSLNYKDECDDCERKRKNDEDSQRMTNTLLGDCFNTGIPGGIDMDITTPW
jgi:hypothetical protein